MPGLGHQWGHGRYAPRATTRSPSAISVSVAEYVPGRDSNPEARRDELEALREIERRAGRAFAAIGRPEIAADGPPSVAELEAASS